MSENKNPLQYSKMIQKITALIFKSIQRFVKDTGRTTDRRFSHCQDCGSDGAFILWVALSGGSLHRDVPGAGGCRGGR